MDRENEENEPLTNLYNFEDLKAGLEDDTDKEVSEEIRPKVAYGYIEDEGYYEGEDDSEDGYEGGVFEKYDRDSDMNGPSEELKDYAQQAIANYNEGKRKSQHYSVVEIMRAELYQVNGFLVFMHFTAKQGDSDAIYFRAQLWDKCDEPYADEVMFIGPITEEEVASKQLRDTSRYP